MYNVRSGGRGQLYLISTFMHAPEHIARGCKWDAYLDEYTI